MPLTPDEVDAMEEVFRTIGENVESVSPEDDTARELFRDYMNYPGGGIDVLSETNEPPSVHKASKADIIEWRDPYDASYGLDSGTTRPESYNNGVVLDVAKARAAMLGDGDESIEELTTIIAAVYLEDNAVIAEQTLRDGAIQSEVIPIQYGGQKNRVSRAVSTRAQKFAEGKHAKRVAGLDGPLFIDGSIYPRSLISTLYFAKEKAFQSGGTAGLAQSTGKKQEQTIVENYIDAVDAQMDAGYPFVGVVKTMTTDQLVQALETKMTTQVKDPEVPWPRDDQFMSDVLYTDDPDAVTFTSWLVMTKLTGGGKPVEPMRGFDIAEDREFRDYRRTFFYVRLPQSGMVFRVEAPLMMVRDKADRNRIRLKALREIVDAGGPPAVVGRADTRANISMDNAKYLKKLVEESGDMDQTKDYNQHGRFEQFRYDNDGDTQ